MAKVLGVGGVFIKAARPRRLAQWYSRCLGVPLAAPGVATFSPASMPKDGYTVWSTLPSSTRYFRPSRQHYMVNLVVDDLDEALQQVAAAGGTAVGRVREYPYGRFGWFLDPEGKKVELWQPPQARPTRPRKRR
jgi:predicted enzyme related to lactoylglutathione lyase